MLLLWDHGTRAQVEAKGCPRLEEATWASAELVEGQSKRKRGYRSLWEGRVLMKVLRLPWAALMRRRGW